MCKKQKIVPTAGNPYERRLAVTSKNERITLRLTARCGMRISFPSRMRAVRHRRTTLGTFPYIQKGYFVEAMPKFRY